MYRVSIELYVSLTGKKTNVCVVNFLLPFLATDEARVLEKKANETQVSETVFSHLKATAVSMQQTHDLMQLEAQ